MFDVDTTAHDERRAPKSPRITPAQQAARDGVEWPPRRKVDHRVMKNAPKKELAPITQRASFATGVKKSLYIPDDMLAEIKAEALRQDRPVSWIMQISWRIAREKIFTFPSAP